MPSSALHSNLDGIAAIRGYVDRVVTGDGKCRGMKVLLLDSATTQVVSCVYSQTEILSREVYLVSRIDDPKRMQHGNAAANGVAIDETQSHLHAVCFLRPTEVSVGMLARELARPRFAEYHVFFTGILTSGLLRLLAEKDVHERVRQVQEFYADFVPINEELFTINCRNTLAMTMAAGTSWAPQYAHLFDRNLQGLQAMLLGLRRQPTAIRYASRSPCAEEVARDMHDLIGSDEIFSFRQRTRRRGNGNTGGSIGGNSGPGSPMDYKSPNGQYGGGNSSSGGLLLLVLDRRDDPVTPLLSQWTYQAMVHELLGLNNHRVILKGAPNITKDLEEVVLSAGQDDFFRDNRHKNFGELGEEIQRLLQDYQQRSAQAQQKQNNLKSIEDMQAFMEQFPELRQRSHKVSKHVAIMGELARLVETCALMDVSQFEQELACSDDHTAHWRELSEKLKSPNIQIADKLRLGLLYALRYETSGNLHLLQQAMIKGGVPAESVKQLVPALLRYGGVQSRGPGLYGEHPDNNLMAKMTKSFITSVQGVSNVYSQHVPVLLDTLQAITRGKLRRETHPFVDSSAGSDDPSWIPDEVIVYMVGGVTYEEGTKIAEFNQLGRMQVVLGGSTVHNSTSFLEELKVADSEGGSNGV